MVKFCPYCGQTEIEENLHSVYCPECKVVIFIQKEYTSADSPLLRGEGDGV